MWLQRVALGIAGIVGVGIIVIGVRFLLVPVESAAGYGLPALAADDTDWPQIGRRPVPRRQGRA
jgi:hypothetical protein